MTFCYTEDTQQPFVKMKKKKNTLFVEIAILHTMGKLPSSRSLINLICDLHYGRILRVLLIIVGCYHHRLLTMSVICLDHQLKI